MIIIATEQAIMIMKMIIKQKKRKESKVCDTRFNIFFNYFFFKFRKNENNSSIDDQQIATITELIGANCYCASSRTCGKIYTISKTISFQ